MQFAMKRNAANTAKPVRCACISESDRIEQMRKTLRHTYYHIPREINMHEVDILLKPLFQDVSLDITLIGKKVHIIITNKQLPPADFDTNFAVLDLVNDWGMHDKMRRFLIRALTSANKHNIYRYAPEVCWKCPMDVSYVFAEEEGTADGGAGGLGDICI